LHLRARLYPQFLLQPRDTGVIDTQGSGAVTIEHMQPHQKPVAGLMQHITL
jgi:hypothetical protein